VRSCPNQAIRYTYVSDHCCILQPPPA
jgi:hypothetical protein